MLVTEDLYVGYHDGFPCVDASQQSNFLCKVVLLLFSGDYPALAKVTGFTHAGDCHCHWCHQSSKKDMAVHRHDSGNFRRWLHPASLERAAGGNFSRIETRVPPRFRTHSEVVRTGVQASNWSGSQNLHPGHTAGISEWCPLSLAPNFDLVWDIVADFMHLVLWYPHHLLPALKGELKLAKPTILALVHTKNGEVVPLNGAVFTSTVKENKRRERVNVSSKKVRNYNSRWVLYSVDWV